MKKRLARLRGRIRLGYYKIFGPQEGGVFKALSFLLALFFVEALPGMDAQRTLPGPIFTILLALVYYILIRLASALLKKVFPRVLGQGTQVLVLVVLNFQASYDLVTSVSGRGQISRPGEIILALIPLVLALALGALVSSVFKNKRRGPVPVLLLVLVLFAWGIYGLALLSPGLDRAPRAQADPAFKNLPREGTYEVQRLVYGPGQDLDLGTTSLSHRAGASGWVKKVRDRLLGHSLSAVPLEGVLYLPKTGQPAPLLVFAHGNHNMLEDNDLGYDYLGQALAQEGYAFASINASSLNGHMRKGVGNENDARALLLLRQAYKILDASEDPSSPIYGRIDQEGIVLGGHSRGGEAAGIAALFNQLEVLPDDGTQARPRKLDVRGVLAVAPTYDQYSPADKEVKIQGPSYLVIHGSHDQDVTTFRGMDLYKNVDPGPGGFKAGLLVGRANHSNFNRTWAPFDKAPPGGLLLNRGDLLAQEDQERVLEVYALAFMEALFEAGPREVFYQAKSEGDYLPPTSYYNFYQPPGFRPLADFEEDLDPLTGTGEGVQISGTDLYVWKEGGFPFTSGRSYNHVVSLKAQKNGRLSLDFPPAELGQGLALDIGRDEPGQESFNLVVRDGRGQEARLDLSQVKDPQDPLILGRLKVQHLSGNFDSMPCLETLIVPRDLLRQANPRLDLDRIVGLDLLPPPHERVHVDKIGLINGPGLD